MTAADHTSHRLPPYLRPFALDDGGGWGRGDMRPEVGNALRQAFESHEELRPYIDTVLADAVADVARLAVEHAAGLDGCEHVDDCRARALALRYLAAWLHPEEHRRPGAEGEEE